MQTTADDWQTARSVFLVIKMFYSVILQTCSLIAEKNVQKFLCNGKVAYGEVAYGEVAYREVTYGEVAYGEVAYGEVAIRPTRSCSRPQAAIILILKRGQQCKVWRERFTVQRPQPHNRQKEEKTNPRKTKRDRAANSNKKSIGPALKTNQSHTIEYRSSEIVPKRH